MTIYLDYAASAPVRPEAREAFVSALAVSGNPSSIHRDGQRARQLVEDARAVIASSLSCDPIEIVFTSGGTESVNLGITGLFRARHEADPQRNRIVVPEAEHHATMDTVEALAIHEGAVIDWIPVDSIGRISVEAWGEALQRSPETIAVASFLWANNEVGTIQPVAQLASLAHATGVPVHVDAVAAFGHLDVRTLPGITTLSVAGHKVGSVPGIGALFVSRAAKLQALIHGGGQQRELRSGTQSAALASSLAAAVSASEEGADIEEERLARIRHDFVQRIREDIDGVTLTGDLTDRLENNVHLVVEGASSADMLYLLDEAGISVSAGSACQAGVSRPSHVLLAMGFDEKQASSSLRITFGHATSARDIDALLDALPAVIEKARTVSSGA